MGPSSLSLPAAFALLLPLLLTVFLFSASAEMDCLVARPGFGLVSEHCPRHTVGCRIRIEDKAVSFYEYSPLYDRNQFVCVLKGEFGEQHGSGCVRKRSGRVRCWCFGRSNCNTPENSKLLFEAFQTGDEAKFHEAVQKVDFTDLEEQQQQMEDARGTPSAAPTQTTKITSTKWTTKVMPPATEPRETRKTAKMGTAGGTMAPTRAADVGLEREPMPKGDKRTKGQAERAAATSAGRHGGESALSSTDAPLPLAADDSNESSAANSSVRSEYDRRNRVHIIHVSARDHYEPVNVFGSPALQRIMAEERRLLRGEVADNSGGEEEEEDNELEELEEEWEGGGQQQGEKGRRSQRPRAKATVAEGKPPAGEEQRGGAGQVRLQQRERTSSSTAASSELEEQLQDVLGSEYFDSAFLAPASALRGGMPRLALLPIGLLSALFLLNVLPFPCS